MTSSVRQSRGLLVAMAAWLLLLGLAPGVQAGTSDAPEITDPTGDHVVVGAPAGSAGQFTSADILKGWVEENGSVLLFYIDVAGTGNSGTAGPYLWNFQATAGAAAVVMGATSTTAQPTPTGVATAAVLTSGVIILTVPRDAFGGATVLTGLHIRSSGGTPTQVQPTIAWSDIAPNGGAGAGISYTMTGAGSTGGNQTLDLDADGLNDTWEMEQFGNTSVENGTGDPDADGLNNTGEFAAGTNATVADTDGDGVRDGDDPAPLDPEIPALTNTTDRDNDTLPDMWERQHFNGTAAQNATGDPDVDGLNNSAEFVAGTNPNRADTDGDGVEDRTDAAPLDSTVSSAAKAAADTFAKPELYAGALMFAAAATFCLLGLARLY